MGATDDSGAGDTGGVGTNSPSSKGSVVASDATSGEYLEEKQKHEAERKEERLKNLYSVYEQRTDSVEKAYKRNGGKKRV